MTRSAETVEYAVRCADGRLLAGHYSSLQAAATAAYKNNHKLPCGPHTIVQRRRIVTDWQPVDGEQ